MKDKIPVQKQRVDGVLCAKVRIPVAINADGEWLADGFWSRSRAVAMQEAEGGAAECGFGSVAVHFVYALVPIPHAQVCYGEVVDDENADYDFPDEAISKLTDI